MKKVIYSVAVAATMLIVACGPSAEEIAKKEAARMDSIAKVTADSLAVIEAEKQKAIQDSINAAMEKMKQDSILAAEEAAAKKKGGKTKPKKVEPKKPEQGTNQTGAGGRGGAGDGQNKTGSAGRK
jgi:thiamine biosynthesis lipoprotein ApbE